MAGLEPGRVRLARYDRDWPRQYRREDRRLRRILGPMILEVAHIGSTAVPGLPAKPILDIAVKVRTLASIPRAARALTAGGYAYLGTYGLRGRHFFTRGNPVTHHIHVVGGRSRHWVRWLAFREHLRTHAEARNAYRKFKMALARQFADDRSAYTAGKNPFIRRTLRQLEVK